MTSSSLNAERVESALFGLDHEERDQARATLIRGGSVAEIKRVVKALCAPLDVTRRRAARLLSELPPHRALPLLEAQLSQLKSSPQWLELKEPLVLFARLITTLSEEPSPLLSSLTQHPHPKVRRAALSPITCAEDIFIALSDERREVVQRASELCLRRALTPPLKSVERALERHPALDELLRLCAQVHPNSTYIARATQEGDPLALRYSQDSDQLCALLQARLPLAEQEPLALAQCLSAAWRLPQLLSRQAHELSSAQRQTLYALARAPSPALRMSAARGLPQGDEVLKALTLDPDTGVSWLAQRAEEGAYHSAVLEGRLGPHERLSSPSARPPYGLRPYDDLPNVPRVRAALALCNARFDVNVGVALRSAEAAGFERLFLIGASALSLSPTRGAELAIPLEVISDPLSMIERARELGYQPVAVQQTPDSKPYHQAHYPPRPLFILGSEDAGLPDELRWSADLVVEIPLFGLIDSLNVATAATCVMMHWRVHHAPEQSAPP